MDMGAAFDIEAISGAFAKAAIDPGYWGFAMEAVSEATHSYGAILFDINSHLPGIPRSRTMEPSFEAYVHGGWIDRDVRYRIAPVLEHRGVATDFDIMAPDQISRDPYYQEFLAPFGLRWFAGVKVAAGDDFWCLSIQRSIEQGPFDQSELLELGGLSKQLGTAAVFANAVGFARVEAALDAFCASATPAVMLGHNGTVIGMNGPAENLLDEDLRVLAGRLVSGSRNASDAFDRSLNELLKNPGSATMPPVQMPRPRSGRRPLLAYLLRLPKVTHTALSPCQATAIFIDPDLRPSPAGTVLMSCFGLTRAEAKLAGMLAGGDCLITIAEHLSITYETARNQLKAVFAKTETHRQSDLMALLSRFPVSE
ncbi:helix-turn-helix transcriptional regulator [Mesorhizobium sp. M0959]|uniref:helix-turn-helix transcriptional regulator n=1 Tax=Mesorhizobium sp. M0959 TaxID=2957034 RepID=UPI00333C89C2